MKNILRLLVVLHCAVLFASCYTPRKAQRQILRAQTVHPEIMAANCASFYPIRRFDSTITRYVQGQPVHDTSWVTVDCDSVLKADLTPTKSGLNKSLVRIPCPPAMHRVDTFLSENWSVQENTAALAAKDTSIARLNAALTQSKGEVVKARSGRNAWRTVALISLAIIILAVAIRFLKPKLIS
jgi:hypothetical protein